MTQYEIWWANLAQPVGRRPVLLLSRGPAFEYSNKVIAVEVTTTVRGIPQELALSRREGLPAPCVANFDHVHVVPKSALVDRIGVLPPARIPESKRALGAALDWSELKLA